jgi:hypothetical protein
MTNLKTNEITQCPRCGCKDVDLGIASLEETNRRVKNKNKPWYKRIFNFYPL